MSARRPAVHLMISKGLGAGVVSIRAIDFVATCLRHARIRGKRASRLVVSMLMAAAVLSPLAPSREGVAAGTLHAPIAIYTDGAFTAANGVAGGSGTPSDPYIIEGWDINASAGTGIDIEYTHAYFVVRDVSVHDGGSGNDGIYLNEAPNGRVENATVANNRNGIFARLSGNVAITGTNVSGQDSVGIWLESSSPSTISGNRVSSSGYWGIHVSNSKDSTIAGNNVSYNNQGIDVYKSSNVTIVRNSVWSTGYGIHTATSEWVTVAGNFVSRDWFGIILQSNKNSTVIGNEVVSNSQIGLLVNNYQVNVPSSNITIARNHFSLNDLWDITASNVTDITIIDNNITLDVPLGWSGIELSSDTRGVVAGNIVAYLGYGIRLGFTSTSPSTGMRVHHNNIIQNFYQASDQSGPENEWDDGYPSGGNYWSDYTGPDKCSGPAQDVCPDPDGIGDVPYVIDSNSQDDYPLMKPVDRQNKPPFAFFTASPSRGGMNTIFSVNASLSWDSEDPVKVLQVRWDWEDDGVWDTSWSTDKVAMHRYNTPGAHTIRLEVKDTGSLADETVRQVLVIDEPPTASFTVTPLIGGVGTIFSFDASGSHDPEDGVAVLQVRWDWENDGAWDTTWSVVKTANHQYGVPGIYAIRLEVRNKAGLTDTTTRQVSVFLGPQTSLVIDRPNYTTTKTFVTSATTLSLSVLDQGGMGISHTWYRIDNLTWIEYSSPFFLLAEGDHYVQWYSEDNVGNVEAINSRTLRVDDSPPATTVFIGNPKYLVGGNFVTSSAPITLQAVDGGITPVGVRIIKYRIDSSVWNDYSSSFTLTAEGTHTVECQSSDLLTNEETIKSVQLIVDNTPPATTISPATGPYTVGTIFTVSATDSASGVKVTRYRIDGGTLTDYSGGFTVPAGVHNISYLSIDNLENAEQEKWLVVTVQGPPPPNTPPTMTIIFPSGGEVFYWGDSPTVTWTSSDAEDPSTALTFWINYTSSEVNGVVCERQLGVLTCDWPLPSITATDIVVNGTVIDTGGLKGYDDSGPFTIQARPNTPPTITITSPSGGESWTQGSSQSVTWTASDNEDASSALLVWVNYTSSAGGGSICGPVAGNLGPCSWTLPTITATDVVVLGSVVDTGGLRGFDDSEQFTIQAPLPPPNAPPIVMITSPVGGEEWLEGTSHAITWSMHDDEDENANLTIYINYTAGGVGNQVAMALKGNVSFEWILPGIEADNVVVNITVIDTGGLRGWNRSGPFKIVKPPLPPSVEANYKPLVALMFAIILAVVGFWSSKKRPWKGEKDKMAVAKAFIIFSLPFVLAEAVTGVVSFATGQLSFPPLIGVGTLVDLAILLVGMVVAILRMVRIKPSGVGKAGTMQKR